jgi:hypothetical protein
LESLIDVHLSSSRCRTALYCAFSEGKSADAIQLLIDYGAEYSKEDKNTFKAAEANAVITFADFLQRVQQGKEEKAKVFTAVRDQRDLIPELWDIVMSYTKIPGYTQHVIR